MKSVEGTSEVILTWYNNTLSRLFCQNDTIWNLYGQMANETDKAPIDAFKKSLSPFRIQVDYVTPLKIMSVCQSRP